MKTLLTKPNAEAESASNETFFDVKKGNETTIGYCSKSIITVSMDELESHPLNHSIYEEGDQSRIKCLAQNIQDHSLINRIIVNRQLQILSGNLRFKALQLLGVKEIEVYEVEIDHEDELEFIISSNQQREKTLIDARNEIMTLYEKYSPGQGNRESKGENTVKKIASITGYSTHKISTIRKIDETFPSLLVEVDKGNLTLNSASKQCDKVNYIQNLSELLGEDLLKDLSCGKIDVAFDKGVKDYCKESRPEYYSLLMNNGISTIDAYQSVFPNENPRKKEKATKEATHFEGPLNDTSYCPCCAQKLKKNHKELEWIKKWDQKIREFVINLKLPTDVEA